MKINKRTLLPLGILTILLVSEILMNKIDVLRYADEIITIGFMVYLIINVINKKIFFSKNIKLIIITSIVITFIGLISNIIWGIQDSIFATLVDILANFKLLICFIGFYYMIQNNEAKEIVRILYKPSKIMLILGTIFSIISLFIDIGMRGEFRFGIYCFHFIFGHAHIYALMIIFCILIIFSSNMSSLDKNKYLFLAMIQMLLTTKGPSIIWVCAVLMLLVYFKKRDKINLKLLGILFIVTIILGQYQIKNYFFEEKAPRAIFYKYSVITATRYFPLGSGFATYGSDMAGKYYSPLYIEYGFNNNAGMQKEDNRFLNDNYWPLILGQFGILGFIGGLFIIYKFFEFIQKMKVNSNIKAIIMSAFFYSVLMSIGSSIYTASATIIMFLGIIIAWRVDENNVQKIINDEEKNKVIESIKRAIKKGDLLKKIFCLFLIKIGFSNDELQAMEIRNKKYKKFERKYQKYIKNTEYKENNKDSNTNTNVWILWLQGEENAPDMVKKCIETVRFYMKDKIINVIDQNNLSEFITLPDFIIKKWKAGIIPNTHLSDIIRTELLIKYGGTWIDATTYLTGPVPDYVYRNNLFMFKFNNVSDKTIMYNSWFIYAEKDNRILKAALDLLYEYWKKENKLKEYFLWHFCLTMAVKKYSNDEYKIPHISDIMSHMLQFVLTNKYDSEYWQDLTNITSIHKLTYKLELNKDISNTYYEYILNNKIGEKNE